MIIDLTLQFLVRCGSVCHFLTDFTSHAIKLAGMVIDLTLQFLVRFGSVCHFLTDFTSHAVELAGMIIDLTLQFLVRFGSICHFLTDFTSHAVKLALLVFIYFFHSIQTDILFFINLIVVINGCILHCIMDHAADDRSILNRVMDLSSYNGSPLSVIFVLQIADRFALRFINGIVVVNGRVLCRVFNHAANDRSILDRVMDLSSYNGSPLGFVILLQIADCFALRFINLIVVVNGCILYYVMNHAADDRTTLHSIQPVIGCHILFQPGNIFILFPIILLQIANGTLLTVNLSLQIADVAL